MPRDARARAPGVSPRVPGLRCSASPALMERPQVPANSARAEVSVTHARHAPARALCGPCCLAASGWLIRGKKRLDLGDVLKRSMNRALVRDFKEAGLLSVGQVPLQANLSAERINFRA